MKSTLTNLAGKTAFVTGGGRDIGAQTSRKLAAAGARVCLNYFGSRSAAEETLKAIQAEGGEAIAVRGNMTQAADIASNLEACRAAFGPTIDILVNVAGGLVARKTMEEMDEIFWDTVIGLNVKSAFLVTKAVLPRMPSGGAIINFSSQAARDGGGPGSIAYASAKGAILTFTRGLAKELGPKGIRVNAVSPGMIDTTFHNTFTKPEVRQRVAAGTPLRREGEAGEVADLVVYLASGQASFISGASVEINGGSYFA